MWGRKEGLEGAIVGWCREIVWGVVVDECWMIEDADAWTLGPLDPWENGKMENEGGKRAVMEMK